MNQVWLDGGFGLLSFNQLFCGIGLCLFGCCGVCFIKKTQAILWIYIKRHML